MKTLYFCAFVLALAACAPTNAGTAAAPEDSAGDLSGSSDSAGEISDVAGSDAPADIATDTAATDAVGTDAVDTGGSLDSGDAKEPLDLAPELPPNCGTCGDGNCAGTECGETVDNCPKDCATCGDGKCSPGESPATCKADCCGGCGDGVCKGYECGENPSSCAKDCGTACGNKVCDKGESPSVCPSDCIFQTCGNNECEPEDGGPKGCPKDCGTTCGNCLCEKGESFVDCPIDCGFCGDGVCSHCPQIGENNSTCFKDCPSNECDVGCDDKVGCTEDACGSTNKSLHFPDAGLCDDKNPCTDDSCDVSSGCKHANNQALCDDANPCTKGDQCGSGSCVPGIDSCGCADASVCDDKNPCTDDSCESSKGCIYALKADGAYCNDGQNCTTNDQCTGGKCAGTIKTCDNSNPCVSQTCNPTSGYCDSVNTTANCEDGNSSTSGDHCVDGYCKSGKNSGSCDANYKCDDNDPCTSETCSLVNNKCVYNPLVCDDGNPCTADFCAPASGCTQTSDDKGIPAVSSCAPDDCSVGISACQGGKTVCNWTGANAAQDGKKCGNGLGICTSGKCFVDSAPTFTGSGMVVVAMGSEATVSVNVTDLESSSDIVSVFADLSSVGGASAVTVTAGSSDTFSVSFATSGLATGTYVIPITATDKSGKATIAYAPALVYTGAVIPVGSAEAYKTIQDGVNAASSGDVVLVDTGTYSGSGNKEINPLGKNILIVGKDGPASTTIDCGGTKRAFTLTNPGSGLHVSIGGFAITNCAASGIRITAGGGAETADVTLANCVITGNTNGDKGGGLYAKGSGVNVNLVQTRLLTNKAQDVNGSTYDGGGIWLSAGKLTASSCEFSQNSGYSAMQISDGGNVTFLSSSFSGNSGSSAVLYADTNSTLSIKNSKIIGETSTFLTSYGALTISGTEFSKNARCVSASNNYGSCSIDSCSFIANSATSAIVSQCNTSNCLFANNKAAVVQGGTTTNAVISGNDTGNNWLTSSSLNGCEISGNTGWNTSYHGDILNTRYVGNVAMHDTVDSATNISNCTFIGNTAKGPAVIEAPTSVLNALIAWNTGNGIRADYSTALLSNLTVVSNTGALGAGINLDDTKVKLQYSILWDNVAASTTTTAMGAQIFVKNTASNNPVIQFCDIRNDSSAPGGDIVDDGSRINAGIGFFAGIAGNLSTNPQFVKGPNGDYYLAQTAAGQSQNSVGVDPQTSGSLTPVNASAVGGLDKRTTRTDGVTDVGTLDLGWHAVP